MQFRETTVAVTWGMDQGETKPENRDHLGGVTTELEEIMVPKSW